MTTSLETQLATLLGSLLHAGMRLERSTLETMRQVLDARETSELGVRLSDAGDAEAWSMRDLALFPDRELALAVEGWLMEQEALCDGPVLPELDLLARLLGRPQVRLLLPDQGRITLTMDRSEVQRLLSRLKLGRKIPEAVRATLAAAQDPETKRLLPSLRLACRQARLPWEPVQEVFFASLLHGSIQANSRQGSPRDAGDTALARHFLPLVQWSLRFLEHAGEDIPAALARRREELHRFLDQAAEMERVREHYNYETRRMLGIMEQHLDPAALREELALVELTARATGRAAPSHQVMRSNLGSAGNMEELGRLLGTS